MNQIDEQIGGLEKALASEAEAARQLADSLDRVRERIEGLDPAGQRTELGRTKDAFEELTRSASMRNSLAGRLAVNIGLKREMTVAEIMEKLGGRGEKLTGPSTLLMGELERAKNNMTVLSLLSKYGYAMMASLTEIRGSGLHGPSYGKNGHRTASYKRSGKIA